ncbi:hypothetical protein MMC19_003504 [Ptychographa xylographoides]|nr:hypothetical protein [Ptychographa xylographoides]
MAPALTERKIRLVRPAHVYYKHKNIEKADTFLKDFGFIETKRVGGDIYYRGYGSEPFVYCAQAADEDVFGGAAFVVQAIEDLELAAEVLPGATRVYDLVDAPGGGRCVTFKDPVDGFPFHLVFGQRLEEPSMEFQALPFNFPGEKNRPVNKTQRFKKGPAPIHKLGHFGMCVTNFAAAYSFYMKHFNFYPSELVHDDAGTDITTFLRLDLGKEQVDHHCFFFFEGPVCHVHHSSFEVHDFDIQVLGHDWLREKGYRNCWGVGRHVMGSQIFDYW